MDQSAQRLQVVVGVAPEQASMIFVSTDANGTPGDLNEAVQKSLGVTFPVDRGVLASQGYQVVKLPRGPLLVWIVTVGGRGPTAEQLRKNLRKALPDALSQLSSLEIGNRLWVPLMGTGAGGMSLEDSASETLNAFADELSQGDYSQLSIDISLHPKTDEKTLERISQIAQSERYVRVWGDDGQIEGDRDVQVQTSGFGLKFQRETSQTLALDRDKFALALARLFKIAEGEFSLALLGRWGSGKTTIAKKIVQYIRDEKSYSEDFFGFFRQPPAGQDTRTYDVVNFNAWRYRRQPELWIWLYESFVSTYLSTRLDRRIVRSIRAGVEKQGFMATIWRLLLLAFAAFPFMWITLALPYGIAIFGISGLIGLIFLARRWQSSLRSLVDRYGLVASHHDKLGMQATVGEDLKVLVKSWTKSSQFDRSQKIVFSSCMFIMAMLWATTFWGGTDGSLVNGLKEVHASIFGETNPIFSEELTLSVSFLAWFVWSLIALLFSIAIASDYARVDRILLIVDDLDRCPSEEIVDLVDGIKLMLDDEEVGALVQALVLADDTILEAAIQQRFSDVDGTPITLRAAVREHMEKVFLCHISIPALDADDLEPLVDIFGREFGANDSSEVSVETTSSYGRSQTATTVTSTTASRSEGSNFEAKFGTNGETEISVSAGRSFSQSTSETTETISELTTESAPSFDAAVVLSLDEISALKNAIKQNFANGGSAVVTPRSLRSILFKYQLARMMLQANGSKMDANKLALRLVEGVFSDDKSTQSGTVSRDTLEWVVDLVS